MRVVRAHVSTSGTATKSTERSLQRDLASAGILPGAMPSKAFKWGMMPSKTALSVDAKHSRMMYLTNYLCFIVQSYGVIALCCMWPLKMRTQISTMFGCAGSALTQRFALIAFIALTAIS